MKTMILAVISAIALSGAVSACEHPAPTTSPVPLEKPSKGEP